MFLALLTAYAAHVAAVEPCEYGLELNGRMKYWTVPQEMDPYAAATWIVADIREALGDGFAGGDCAATACREAAVRRELLQLCSLRNVQYVVQATDAASSPPPLPQPPPGAPLAEGCTVFDTAFQEFPAERTSGYRPLFSPAPVCPFPRQLRWHYDPGDEFWFRHADKYPWHICVSVHYWLAHFFGAWHRVGGRPGLVVDVGANIGQESIISASFGHHALAFEPFADTLRTASFNARVNCLPDTITWVNAGTSDKPGRSCGAAFATDNSHTGIGIFANDIEGGDCMNITTLDATLTTDERPLILKLDNEGSEVATLRGARRLLAERPPLVIILEWIPGYHHNATELVALLSDYDLFPLARHDSNVLSETYHVHDVLGEGLPLRDASGAPIPTMDNIAWDRMLDVLAVHHDLRSPGSGAALARDWGRRTPVIT